MNKFEILQKTWVKPELKAEVIAIVQEFILTARKRFGDKVKTVPEVQFKTKGRTAGWCRYDHFTGKHTIDINPILLNENKDEMLNVTVPHEVAHCVVHQLYDHSNRWSKPQPHGWEWQSVMRAFGLDPDRCHCMDTSTVEKLRNNGVTFAYKCNCQVHHVSQIKHTKMQRGQTRICKSCRGKLVFDNVNVMS